MDIDEAKDKMAEWLVRDLLSVARTKYQDMRAIAPWASSSMGKIDLGHTSGSGSCGGRVQP